MIVSAKLKHEKGLRFRAQTADGRSIDLDSTDMMTNAFTPMELFLFSLAGCTAMDVQWILQKKRQKVSNLEVSVRGRRRHDDPRYYEQIDLDYHVTGEGISEKAVERAIQLSQERYCSVKSMLRKEVDVRVSYRINDSRANSPHMPVPIPT